MNRLLRSFIIIGAGLLLVLGSGSAPARAAAQSTTTPFEAVIPDPCTGEDVLVSGSVHLVSNVHQDAHGGYHISGHYNFQGIQGVGLSTGTAYRWTGGAQIAVHYGCGDLCTPPFEETSGSNFQLVGQGATPNEQVHALTHITINANGVVTADVQVFHMACH